MIGDNHKRLPREVQIALGRKLRDVYRSYVDRLPLHLVGLAHRVTDVDNRHPVPLPFGELRNLDRDVFDPDTIRILDEAFDKAWNDLQSLKKNPATEDSLALVLMALVKEGERNPSQLATKAVLKLIAPRPEHEPRR